MKGRKKHRKAKKRGEEQEKESQACDGNGCGKKRYLKREREADVSDLSDLLKNDYPHLSELSAISLLFVQMRIIIFLQLSLLFGELLDIVLA